MAKTGAVSLHLKNSGLERMQVTTGMICRVIDKLSSWDANRTDNSACIKKGDIVRIIKIYPNVVLVEKIASGESKLKVRECFTRRCLAMTLKPL